MESPPLPPATVQLKRGAWNEEEDRKLVDYIKRYGIWNWNLMPQAAGLLRSGKSCRLRWMNYLRPNIRHGNFTRQEEDIIIKWHKVLGNKWSTIAAKLPGRTDNEIKNVWNTYLKKRTTYEKSKEQQPNKMSVVLEKTTPTTSAVSSIDNRSESESEGEGNTGLLVPPDDCFWVNPELHDNMLFDDDMGGVFLPNCYYQQESLNNEWVIDDLWTS